MLQIDISTQQMRVARHSPHAGYYVCAAIVPGTPGDVLLVGPAHARSKGHVGKGHARMQFTLALTAASDHRPSSHFPALMPPRPSDAESAAIWDAIMTLLATYDYSTLSLSEGILDLTILEWLSASMPRNVDGVEVDAMVRQGLENWNLTSAATSQIPAALLTSRRIGHVRLSLAYLLQLWRRTPHPQTLQLPVQDLNVLSGDPVERGFVTVTVQHSPHVAISAPVHRRLSQLGLPSVDIWTRLYQPAIEEAQRCYEPYIRAYLQPFPLFNAPFKLVQMGDREAGFFVVQDDDNVAVGGQRQARLRADKNDMNNIHMPTARIDGLPAHVPIHHLFETVSNRKAITSWHQRYFGAVCDAECVATGNDSTGLATVIHAYLDGNATELTPAMLAAVRTAMRILTIMATATTYRSDVTVAATDNGLEGGLTVSGTEDIARDGATCITSSIDCEDGAFTIHYIYTTILQGSDTQKPATDWQERDLVWKQVYAPRGFVGGGWSHPGLDAIQRLLSRYCVANVLGTVTAAFPGEDRAISTTITDLDAAERSYLAHNHRDPAYEEIRKHIYTSEVNQQSTSEAHRWAVAIPLDSIVHVILKTTEREDVMGSQRHPMDRRALDELRAISTHLHALPPLPSVTLEGTTPVDPYCVVGASHWLPESHPERAALRALEVQARRLAVEFRQNIAPRWARFGAMHLDGGAFRHLPGNLPERQGSQFYSRALQFDAWIIGRLVGDASSLTTFACTHGEYGARWGVPVDRLLQPRLGSDISLLPTTHRIPYSLRQRYEQTARIVTQLLLPARLGDTSPLDPDIQLPAVAPSNTLTMWGVQTFAWVTYYLHGEMGTSEETIEAYRRTINPHNGPERHYKQKLLGLGHETLVWAVHI